MSRNQESVQLEPGQKVRDASGGREGVIMDTACQYAHPKAAPVYSYMIRWQDGQVQAYSEAAFQSRDGIQLVD